MIIKRFEDLDIWQKARNLSKAVYEKTVCGTFEKDYGLRDQINKSSGSVMDNIAEGFEREGRKEFIHFLSIAKSSAAELRSQLYRAFDRKHLDKEEFDMLLEYTLDIGKMLGGFMKYLKNCEINGLKYKVSEIEIDYVNNKGLESGYDFEI